MKSFLAPERTTTPIKDHNPQIYQPPGNIALRKRYTDPKTRAGKTKTPSRGEKGRGETEIFIVDPIRDEKPSDIQAPGNSRPPRMPPDAYDDRAKKRRNNTASGKKQKATHRQEKRPKSSIPQGGDPPRGKQKKTKRGKRQSGTRSGVLSPKLGIGQ